jgi:hypothetical protein
MMSIHNIPERHCVGCYQCTCSGPCLATHRDRYCCHNPSCRFHAPFPAPPELIAQRTAQPAAPETRAIEAPNPANANEGERETISAGTLGNSNVTLTETFTREWILVGGEPVTRQVAAPGPTTSVTTSATPVEDRISSAVVDQSYAPPVRLTIEEYEAQSRLLAQYQPRQGRQTQRAQGDGRTLRISGGGQGTSRRPRVWIGFD